MKNNQLFLTLFFIMTALTWSCKKTETGFSDNKRNLDLDFEITQANPSSEEIAAHVNYNYLGYGYDVTRRFEHPSAIRNAVIDVDALGASEAIDISQISANIFFPILGENAESFSGRLSNWFSATYSLHQFKGAITDIFNQENALTDRYIYGHFTHAITTEEIKFKFPNMDMGDHLYSDFELDLDRLSVEELIEKYGTHIMMGVALGGKFTVDLQAEYNGENRDNAIGNTLALATEGLFEEFSGVLIPYDKSNLQGVSNAKVVYEIRGGDVSRVNVKSDTEIQLSEWFDSINTSNSDFISVANSSKIIPLYDVINDPAKKEAIQNYILSYLKENEVSL